MRLRKELLKQAAKDSYAVMEQTKLKKMKELGGS